MVFLLALPAQKSLTISVCFPGWNQSMSQCIPGKLSVLGSQRKGVGPDSPLQALASQLGHSVTEYAHGFGHTSALSSFLPAMGSLTLGTFTVDVLLRKDTGGKMALRLRAPIAFLMDLESITSTHLAAHNYL